MLQLNRDTLIGGVQTSVLQMGYSIFYTKKFAHHEVLFYNKSFAKFAKSDRSPLSSFT